jgi:predicted nucleotidyltransferase
VIKFGRPVPSDVDLRTPVLVDELTRDERVEAVWLFGSRARNEADALSDIDLAVLADAALEPAVLSSVELEWTTMAVRVLGTDEVGVQVLNRLRVAPRHAILRDARLLWSRSPEIAVDFESRTQKEFLDLRPYLDRYDRDLFRQAATGTLR